MVPWEQGPARGHALARVLDLERLCVRLGEILALVLERLLEERRVALPVPRRPPTPRYLVLFPHFLLRLLLGRFVFCDFGVLARER